MALTLASVELFFCEGSSDKVYNIQLVKDGATYCVTVQRGRRGSALIHDTKITSYEEDKARKVYDKLLAQKTGGGYQIRQGMVTQTGVVVRDDDLQDPTGMLPGTRMVPPAQSGDPLFVPHLLMPIDEDQVEAYLNNSGYVAQEKMDGVHKTLQQIDGRVIVRNKLGKSIAFQPMTLMNGLHIDCEQIGDTFYIFDVMECRGQKYSGRSYVERMEEADRIAETLNNLNEGRVTFRGVPFFQNYRNKKDLYDRLNREGKEGIVFKRIDAHYQSGSRNSDMIKFKFYHELSARVTASPRGREEKRSIGLELVDDDGYWKFMGNCTIGGKKPIPPVGSIVEIKYLYCHRGGHLYQPSFKELRTDVYPADCTMTQVKYKNEPPPDSEPDVPDYDPAEGHIVDSCDRQLDL